MGTSLASAPAHYRLVYVQPDPDNGERVCVGLVFEEGRHDVSVVYDKDFSKARCVAPALDIDLLRFYFNDFENSLRESGEVDLVLRRYSPQLTTSDVRAVVTPVTDAIKARLLSKFAKSVRDVPSVLLEGAVALKRPDVVADHIRDYIESVVPAAKGRLIEHAGPRELLGRDIGGIRRVAVGLRTSSKVVLVDGVDLRALTPQRAITKTNWVVRAFWQYARLHDRDLVDPDIRMQRIGVVLNGVSRKSDYSDAHDYAIDQLRKESDLAIDSSRPQDRELLQAALLEA